MAIAGNCSGYTDTVICDLARAARTGLPNGTVFSETSIVPGTITCNNETRITFDDPFYAEAGQRYALVIASESPYYAVRVAELGEMGEDGPIARLNYTEGALFESANGEAWEPLPEESLTMKVYGADFDLDGVVQFQPITGVQFSELNIDEYSAIPEGCTMLWEYSTDGGGGRATPNMRNLRSRVKMPVLQNV